MASNFMKVIDMKALEIPKDIISGKKLIEVTEGEVIVENAKVFYREAQVATDKRSSDITLLLLHGKNFSSNVWLKLGTIQIVGAMGYRTIAIDIPGYGNSPEAPHIKKDDFLKHVIETFGIKQPVIVSPSMSGFFALPHLIQFHESVTGYIPVAPVGIKILEDLPQLRQDVETVIDSVYEPLRQFLELSIPDLRHIKTPTLVVFGEKDRSKSSALLNLLPNSQPQEIPNGSHPAYLDNPNLWHKLLYNFLHHLSSEKA